MMMHDRDERTLYARQQDRIAALEAELAAVKGAHNIRCRELADACGKVLVLEAELAAERERREAAEKDAARYQWLKINARRIDFAGLCVSDGAQLDARIDAARKD